MESVIHHSGIREDLAEDSREVLNEMVARLDEMRPALLAELERFVAAPESFDEDGTDWMTLTFAAYLLAQARETRAFNLPRSVAMNPALADRERNTRSAVDRSGAKRPFTGTGPHAIAPGCPHPGGMVGNLTLFPRH